LSAAGATRSAVELADESIVEEPVLVCVDEQPALNAITMTTARRIVQD
jgi:hypothetical protein